MKTTAADFVFWTVKQRVPQWAQGFKLPIGPADVNACINRRVNPAREKSFALSNLLGLLAGARRNIQSGAASLRGLRGHRDYAESLPAYLSQLSIDPGCNVEPETRKNWAKRFARGVGRGEARRAKSST